jgi:hypothetical protein
VTPHGPGRIFTDVSEERTDSIFRTEDILRKQLLRNKQQAQWASTWPFTSLKMTASIVIVKNQSLILSVRFLKPSKCCWRAARA